MLLRTSRHTMAVGVATLAAAMATMTTSPASGLAAPDVPAGPPYDFTTALVDGAAGPVVPLKNKAMLTRTKHGYRYRAGMQDNHLVVTRVEHGLRFADRSTARFVKLSADCHRRPVKVGVAAVCRVPRTATVRRPLLVEVWPTLGDDVTDGSTLPATVALAVLADKGDDVARLGAGPDFFNGHTGRDRVWGGAGNDWIRTGRDHDTLSGGAGNDWLVGMEGQDLVHGGPGDDRVAGMDGNDRLYGDAGADVVLGGSGIDRTSLDEADVVRYCEVVEKG